MSATMAKFEGKLEALPPPLESSRVGGALKIAHIKKPGAPARKKRAFTGGIKAKGAIDDAGPVCEYDTIPWPQPPTKGHNSVNPVREKDSIDSQVDGRVG